MPTYTYKCKECDSIFDIQQRITEDSFKIHSEANIESKCSGKLTKILYAPRLDFSHGGAGFYVNDYKKQSSEPDIKKTKPFKEPKLQETIKTK